MRYAFLADLHFGMNERHDNRALEFCDWFIEDLQKKTAGEKAVVYIAGDTFHNRDKVSVKSISKAYQFVQKLGWHFDVRVLTGNHDMPYRDTRDHASSTIFNELSNVSVINNPQYCKDEQVLATPWICNEQEMDKIVDCVNREKPRFVVGHFEFAFFAMNDNYTMEHGANHKTLKNATRVFSGHYHKRQEKDNVIYIGTFMPYDMNDANDTERGYVTYDADNDNVEYHNWNKYSILSMTASEYQNYEGAIDPETTNIRIICESEEQYDEILDVIEGAGFAGTKIVSESNRVKEAIEEGESISIIDGDNVDSVVVRALENTDTEGVNTELLVNLYKEVITD